MNHSQLRISIIKLYLSIIQLWISLIASYVAINAYQNYHKTSNISRTKSQKWNISWILLQLSSLNPLKPCVKLRMKM